MHLSNRLILASAVLLTVACGNARTEDPVVTTDGEGARTTSPSGDAAASRDRSLVRLVNALPSPSSVSIVNGDGDRVIFSGSDYKSVTPYKEITDNVLSFRLVSSGSDSVLATNTEALVVGNRYTIVVFADDKGESNIRVLRDDLEPDAGMARIRLINAAAGLGSVDGAMRGQEKLIFDDVNQGNEAGYEDIAPTSGTFEVRAENRAKAPMQVANISLEAGKAYTVVVAGKRSTKIDLLSFEDVVAPSVAKLSKLP